MNTLESGRNDDPICAAIDAAEEVRNPWRDSSNGPAPIPEPPSRRTYSNALRRSRGTIAPPSRLYGRN